MQDIKNMNTINKAPNRWKSIKSSRPPKGVAFEVLNFGFYKEQMYLIQRGKYNGYGIAGVENEPGEHCKPSTITHWRTLPIA